MSTPTSNTVDSAASLGMQLATPLKVDHNAIPYAVVPNGARLHSLEEFLMRPIETKARIAFTRAASLVAFGQKFKNDAMTVSFDENQAVFQVIVDDHLPGQPAWKQHTASLQLKLSPEAEAWFGGQGKLKARNQEDFSLFIEDHLIDVVKPKGTEVLAMVLEFKAVSSASFSSAIRLSDGNIQLSYAVENKPGNVAFPEKMTIHIPMFTGQHRTEVELRVRYRIHEGKLSLWYEVIGFDLLRQQAIEQYVAQVEEGIGLPVLFRTL